MSERTFRAVVAGVLVVALGLTVVVVVALLPRSVVPVPSSSPEASALATVTPSTAPTPSPGPALMAVQVSGVGRIVRGSSSGDTLTFKFTEASADAIPNAPGSLDVTITDASGDGSTITIVGSPTVDAPGSLGATATLVAPNVLRVSISASDTLNVEPIVIGGLGIRTSTSAATGDLRAALGAFSGSFAGGAASNVVPSPGTVSAGP